MVHPQPGSTQTRRCRVEPSGPPMPMASPHCNRQGNGAPRKWPARRATLAHLNPRPQHGTTPRAPNLPEETRKTGQSQPARTRHQTARPRHAHETTSERHDATGTSRRGGNGAQRRGNSWRNPRQPNGRARRERSVLQIRRASLAPPLLKGGPHASRKSEQSSCPGYIVFVGRTTPRTHHRRKVDAAQSATQQGRTQNSLLPRLKKQNGGYTSLTCRQTISSG